SRRTIRMWNSRASTSMVGSLSALPASWRRRRLPRRQTARSGARRPRRMPEKVIAPARDRTIEEYKSSVKPTWCPGCGDFGVLNAVYNWLRVKGYAPQDVVLVSGMGCSSRLPFFSSTYGFHTVHGRTMPIATGIKVANPKLKVLALGGDGDAFAIGGGHFIHAARRNLDVCYVIIDNPIHRATKVQAHPTRSV